MCYSNDYQIITGNNGLRLVHILKMAISFEIAIFLFLNVSYVE